MMLVAVIANGTELVENPGLPGSFAQGRLSTTGVAFWPVRNWSQSPGGYVVIPSNAVRATRGARAPISKSGSATPAQLPRRRSDSDLRLHYTLRIPPVHRRYSLTTLLTRDYQRKPSANPLAL